MDERWPLWIAVAVYFYMTAQIPQPDMFFQAWRLRLMDPYATLRLAYSAGATIQAWHLNEGATSSDDGRWDDVSTFREPEFSCPVHLYRVKPESAK